MHVKFITDTCHYDSCSFSSTFLLGWAQANLKWPDMCLPHPHVYRLLRPSPGMDSRLLSLLLGGCLRHRTKHASSRIRTGTVSLDIHIRLVYFTPPHNTYFILFFHAQSTSYGQWMLNPRPVFVSFVSCPFFGQHAPIPSIRRMTW